MKRNISLLLIALACLAGCSIDDTDSRADGNATGDGITFVVNLPAQPAKAATYADTDLPAAESMVNKVDVFAFRSDGATWRYVENQRGTDISNDKKLEKTFKAKFAKLEQGESYRFVVLANAREQVETNAYTTASTMDDVMNRFKVEQTGKWNVEARSIPMWGISESVLMKDKDMSIDNLWLLRMLAKIDVTVADEARPKFRLESVRLYRYREQGYVVPAEANLVPGSVVQVNKPTLLGDRVMQLSKALVYDGLEGDDCVNTIYTFETDSAVVNGKLDEDNAHCLVIGGKYGDDPAPTYYKVYFKRLTGSVTSYPSLLRNHHYEVSIDKVNSSGYETPEEAMTAQDVDFGNTIVIKWNTGAMTDVTLDGTDGESNRVDVDVDGVGGWNNKGDGVEL